MNFGSDQKVWLISAVFSILYRSVLMDAVSRRGTKFSLVGRNKVADGVAGFYGVFNTKTYDGITECLAKCMNEEDCVTVQFNDKTSQCKAWSGYENGEIADVLKPMDGWNFYQNGEFNNNHFILIYVRS